MAKAKGVLEEVEVEEVSLVDRAANKRKFIIVKREDMSKENESTPAVNESAGAPGSASVAKGEDSAGAATAPGSSASTEKEATVPAQAVVTESVLKAFGEELREFVRASLTAIVDDIKKAAAPSDSVTKSDGGDVAALKAEVESLRDKVAKQAELIAAVKSSGEGNSIDDEAPSSGGGGDGHRVTWPMSLSEDVRKRKGSNGRQRSPGQGF